MRPLLVAVVEVDVDHLQARVMYRCTQPTPWAVRDPRYEHTDAARGWDRWCAELRIVPVTGHHLNLLDPPAVDMIAADLRRLL